VLVSEFMLQQTQAARVVPVFRSFLRRFPTVSALAAASSREVLRAWSGLGYNRRAVWLLQASRRIHAEHGGRVPRDPAVLATLPGIGPYTASAIASIAFDVPVPAVDTNVRRVVARAYVGLNDTDASPRRVQAAAAEWMKGVQPGVWNQAVMDLGREVCRPIPRCSACPLATDCAFNRRGALATRRSVSLAPFEGSTRQLRGRIVRTLIERPSATVASLSRDARRPSSQVAQAVRALAADGLVRAGPAARAARPKGRVRLAV
jgi:A/G-specific adenine glycosylase